MFCLFLFTLISCIHIYSTAEEQINVFGKKLEPCSVAPMTGFYRTGSNSLFQGRFILIRSIFLGSCEWDGPHDFGVHSVCAQLTNEFLEFTRSRGNDLSTPRGGFPGLREGDRWCLCAGRWREAFNAGKAPPVVLRSTHRISLQHVKLEDLRKHALGNSSRRRVSTKA